MGNSAEHTLPSEGPCRPVGGASEVDFSTEAVKMNESGTKAKKLAAEYFCGFLVTGLSREMAGTVGFEPTIF